MGIATAGPSAFRSPAPARPCRSPRGNRAGAFTTPDAFRLLLGRRYNRMKKAQGAPQGNKNATKQSSQNGNFVKTAERIAQEHGVNQATVRRAAKFAEEVEKTPELSEYARAVGRGQSTISEYVSAARVLENLSVDRHLLLDKYKHLAASCSASFRTPSVLFFLLIFCVILGGFVTYLIFEAF